MYLPNNGGKMQYTKGPLGASHGSLEKRIPLKKKKNDVEEETKVITGSIFQVHAVGEGNLLFTVPFSSSSFELCR